MDIKIDNLLIENITESSDSEVFSKEILFKEGSKILLKGASGKGKTTFISVLYGLVKKFSGSIIYKNRSIKTFTKKHWVTLRKNKISIVFQDLKLFSDLTGYENIQIKNRLTNFRTKEKIITIFGELGIGRLADKKITDMSFGEKQRFALARSFMQPFSWLIMDEPFSHLDNKNREKACGLIERECMERKAGIIIAEHDDENLFDYDMKMNL